MINNEDYAEQQNSDWILVSPQKHPSLVQRLASFTIFIQKSRKYYNFFYSFSITTLFIQLVFAPLYVVSHHNVSPPTSLKSFSYLCSFLMHLIPSDSSNSVFESTSILVFVITVIAWIFLLTIFFSIKHHIIWHSGATHFLVNSCLCYLTVFLPVSTNLLVRAFFSYQEIGSNWHLCLSIFNFLLVFLGSVLTQFFNNQTLSISPIIGATWIPVPLFLYIFPLLLLYASIETIVHVQNILWLSHALLLINILLYVVLVFLILYFLPFVLISFQIAVFFAAITGLLTSLLSLFGGLIKNNDTILMVIFTLALPMSAISFLFIKFATDKGLLTVFSAIDQNDFTQIERMNEYRLSIALCTSFHLISNDYTIFDAAIKSHPNSFLLTFIAGKITALDTDHPGLIKTVLTEMRKRASNSIQNWTTISMFQLAFFDSTHDAQSQSLRMINICNSVVEDFLSSLHLFWTEVLLGRTEKLSSLAQEANSKYNKATAAFAQLSPKYGQEVGMIECFERFKSFVPIRLSKSPFQNYQVIHETLFSESYRLFSQFKKADFSSAFNINTVFSPASSMLQDLTRMRLTVLHHLTTYLPFYFAFALWITFGVFLFSPKSIFHDVWESYRILLETLYDLSGSMFALTMVPLNAESNNSYVLNMSNDTFDNWIFHSNLKDPVNDAKVLLKDAVEKLNYFVTFKNKYYLSDKVEKIFNRQETFYLWTYLTVDEQNLTMFPFLHEYIIQFLGERILTNSNINETFAYNSANALHANFFKACTYITDTIENIINYKPNEILDEFKLSKKNYYMIFPVGVFVLIVVMICFIFLIQTQSELFMPFLSLPKTVVSELLEKLGDKLALPAPLLESLESEQRFYIRQLSYPSPPSSYLTKTGLSLRYFCFAFIIIVFSMALLIPAILIKETIIKTSSQNIISSKTLMLLPYAVLLLNANFVNYENCLIFNYSQNMAAIKRGLLETIKYAHLTYSLKLSNATNMPSFYNNSLYYEEQICNPANDKDNICLSLSNNVMYIITSMLDMLALEEDSFEDNNYGEELLHIVKNLVFLSAITARNLIVPFFASVENHFEQYDVVLFSVLIVDLAIFVLIMIISHLFINSLVFSPYFSTVVLSSVPLHVMNTNEKILDVIAPKKMKDELGFQILNRSKTFETITDLIFLVDEHDEIVLSTPNVAAKLQVEFNEGISPPFTEFIQSLCKYELVMNLPPEKEDNFAITATLTDTTEYLFVCKLIPMKNFSYGGKSIEFACVLQDVTYRDSLINRMNQEANQLRLLMSQIVPTPVAMSMLEDGQFSMFLLNRCCVANFFVSGMHNLTVQQIGDFHKFIRDLVQYDPDLTFIGRSCQHFRVIPGLFSSMITIHEMASKIVSFCVEFMKSLKLFLVEVNTSIDAYCCVHMGSQFLADVIKDPLPVFDLYGTQMNVGELIMLQFPPNIILVTNEMYEVMSEDDYDITYFAYVKRPNGSKYKMYTVEEPIDV